MATSDVLQFNYCINDQVARNATKNFAECLGEAFMQYKKLWMEYLKLRNYCKDVNLKIPFELFDLKSDNNDATFESHGVSSSAKEVSTQDDHRVLPGNTNMSGSPILAMRPAKFRRTSVRSDDSILEDTVENESFLSIKEHVYLETSSEGNNTKSFIEPKQNECTVIDNNNDEVECTPLTKVPKRLGVSKLYNVDTSLLHNGKKLKQSRLVILPGEDAKETSKTNYNPLNTSTPNMSLTPKRNARQNSMSFSSMQGDEEIIEDSPTKRKNSKLKMKSLKLRNKSAADQRKIRNPSKSCDKFSDKSRLSQYISREKDCSDLIKKSKSFNSLENKNIASKSTASSCLSPLVIVEESPIKSSQKENITEMDNNKNQASQARGSSKLCHETMYNNSSIFDEETFCFLGENAKGKPNVKSKDKSPANVSKVSPPVKRNLTDSFQKILEKKDVLDDKTKNRAERARKNGISCWECKKYYTSLGFSEKEIQAKQNQCSRHRTTTKAARSSPEGFWDPLFLETCTSTILDG